MMMNYPEAACAKSAIIGGGERIHNPTLEENIQSKIDWHTSEIERLKNLKATLGDSLMKVNLRDLREAMNF
jgi:hypothetical protein